MPKWFAKAFVYAFKRLFHASNDLQFQIVGTQRS